MIARRLDRGRGVPESVVRQRSSVRPKSERRRKAITRDDIVAFHKAYFQPGHAIVTVVGDIKPEKPSACSTRPSQTGKPAARCRHSIIRRARAEADDDLSRRQTRRRVVDVRARPHRTAAQHARLLRDSRDERECWAGCSSRVSITTSAKKKATATASARSSLRPGPGPFRAGGDIMTAKNDSALVEFMKELRGILGERPVTEEELKIAKDSLVQRLPGTFASVGAINGALTGLWVQSLPDTYYQQYTEINRGNHGRRRRARREEIRRSGSSGHRGGGRSQGDRSAAWRNQNRADR